MQLFVFVFLFWLPHGIRSPPAEDQIRATVAAYIIAVAMLDPLTHCARLEVESVSWCCRDATDPVVPQWEFLCRFLFLFLFCFVLVFFRATPTACGSSQARGQIGAIAASLHHSYSDARSELYL